MKRALITGITGQDGSYLAELLLSKGYEVHGIVRHVALEDPEQRLWRIRHIKDRLHLHSGTLESYASIHQIFSNVMPDECYHLGAQSFVAYSFDDEFSTMLTNVTGTHYVLGALKQLKPDCRFYFAGSSEMFGGVSEPPQSEETKFHPRSTYGISKVAGFHLTQNYKEAYDIHASCGILYNHESPRRGIEFVTRKITSYAAKIKLGLCDKLPLGNMETLRDWGHAKEYVEAMWLMLQQDEPDDYVIATGKAHSPRQFVDLAFGLLDLDPERYVVVDPNFFRPSEVNHLMGNPSKAERELGWKATIPFEELVRDMVITDLEINEPGSSDRILGAAKASSR